MVLMAVVVPALAAWKSPIEWFRSGGASKAADWPAPCTVVAGPEGGAVFVAEYGAQQVAEVDLKDGRVLRRIPLPLPPTGLALDAARGWLVVTLESPEGQVAAIDVKSGKTVFTLPAGHTPNAPVLTADGKTLWIANRFDNEVVAYDLESCKEQGRVTVPREPVACALTPDGAALLVANLLPAVRADGDYVGAEVTLIETGARKVAARMALPNGSTALHGVCVAPDGRFAYVTHGLARYPLPTTQLDRGWMNTSAMSIIDLAGRRLHASVLLDQVDRGAANPWGIGCTADGRWLCIALAGTHEFMVIDRPALHDKLERLAKGEKVSGASNTMEDVPNDLSFLEGVRRRIATGGNGPRGLAIAGTCAVAAEYFSDSLAVLDLAAEGATPRQIALAETVVMTAERQGERIFHDAHYCFQQWQSCASCHPDARVDGLNWDLLNDGLGNPKNGKSMLLSHVTPPAMSLGVRETGETAVRAGFRHIQFTVRPEEEMVLVDVYLKALEPTPSPHLASGKPGAAARRGEKVFRAAGCADCHPAPLFTDLKAYDVGTGKDLDKAKPMDTPSLVEVWRTAPYLHDGRAATMREVLVECNSNDMHGVTSKLKPEEIDDLVEYVLTR